MGELKSAGLLEYATVCGETLARGHARSADPGMIAGYIGTSARFDAAIANFAAAYANQTERDWEALISSRRDQPSAKPSAKPTGKSSAHLVTTTPAAKSSKPAAKLRKPAPRKANGRTRLCVPSPRAGLRSGASEVDSGR
jgi:hypothetical protein